MAPDKNPELNTPTGREIVPAASGELTERNGGNSLRQSWPFSTHNIKANMAHCTPARAETMTSCFLWSIDHEHPVFYGDFVAAMKGAADRTTITRIYQGKYQRTDGSKLDIPEKLAEAAKEWLERRRHNFKGQVEFIITPSYQKIEKLIDRIRERRVSGFLFGASHIGKTWALKHYSHKKNHGASPYVRMRASNGVGGLLRTIGEGLGVSQKKSTLELRSDIKAALSPGMVLLIDEMHQLAHTYRHGTFFACLEVIREILDESGCAMLFCGTQLLMDKVRPGLLCEMEQFLKRGPYKLQLGNQVPIEDLKVILSTHGLQFPEADFSVRLKGESIKPREVLRQLAEVDGLLAIMERVHQAKEYGLRHHRAITWEDFITVDGIIKRDATMPKNWK